MMLAGTVSEANNKDGFLQRVWFSAVVYGFPQSCMVFRSRVWFSTVVFIIVLSAIVHGFLQSCMVFRSRAWFSAEYNLGHRAHQ